MRLKATGDGTRSGLLKDESPHSDWLTVEKMEVRRKMEHSHIRGLVPQLDSTGDQASLARAGRPGLWEVCSEGGP